MAHPVTLYRFRIELSDIERNVYDTLELRLAMHPSESMTYLLTRVMAFVLNSGPELEFSPQGLGDPEVPALQAKSASGNIDLWIEVGSPSAKKIHKAAKAARQVKVYTYKDPKALLKELSTQHIHRLSEIGFFAFKPKQLERLESQVVRDNRWTVVRQEGVVTVSIGENSEELEVLELRPD
jgi:uncharacterized protein YaeQ